MAFVAEPASAPAEPLAVTLPPISPTPRMVPLATPNNPVSVVDGRLIARFEIVWPSPRNVPEKPFPPLRTAPPADVPNGTQFVKPVASTKSASA